MRRGRYLLNFELLSESINSQDQTQALLDQVHDRRHAHLPEQARTSALCLHHHQDRQVVDIHPCRELARPHCISRVDESIRLKLRLDLFNDAGFVLRGELTPAHGELRARCLGDLLELLRRERDPRLE